MPEDSKQEQSAEDVLQMLDSLDKDASKKSKKKNNKSGQNKKETTSSTDNDATGSSNAAGGSKGSKKDEKEEDIMGFLDSLTKSGANSGRSTPAAAAKNPPTEDKSKDSEEKPDPESSGDIPDPIGVLSSWWSKNKGGIWDSASSAVKQAEARVRELQPEVEKNSSQAIESLGGSISKFGISGGFLKNTLSTVLDTIAPPISKHEQLKIHIFHDMVGYPAIDTIVYNVFDRVMQQVEGGGDLTMVVQKGKERHRRGSDKDQRRDLNMIRGDLEHGKKLAAANIEDFISSGNKRRSSTTSGAAETSAASSNKNENENENAVADKEGDSEKNKTDQEEPKVRTSNLYLSIQPTAIEDANKDESVSSSKVPSFLSQTTANTFSFIIYLSDPDHDIKFSTVSQPFPYQWAEWLDHPADAFKGFDADPRDWVIDWIEEGLGLAVGVIAQSYVAKRMGVDTMFALSNSDK